MTFVCIVQHLCILVVYIPCWRGGGLSSEKGEGKKEGRKEKKTTGPEGLFHHSMPASVSLCSHTGNTSLPFCTTLPQDASCLGWGTDPSCHLLGHGTAAIGMCAHFKTPIPGLLLLKAGLDSMLPACHMWDDCSLCGMWHGIQLHHSPTSKPA